MLFGGDGEFLLWKSEIWCIHTGLRAQGLLQTTTGPEVMLILWEQGWRTGSNPGSSRTEASMTGEQESPEREWCSYGGWRRMWMRMDVNMKIFSHESWDVQRRGRRSDRFRTGSFKNVRISKERLWKQQLFDLLSGAHTHSHEHKQDQEVESASK